MWAEAFCTCDRLCRSIQAHRAARCDPLTHATMNMHVDTLCKLNARLVMYFWLPAAETLYPEWSRSWLQHQTSCCFFATPRYHMHCGMSRRHKLSTHALATQQPIASPQARHRRHHAVHRQRQRQLFKQNMCQHTSHGARGRADHNSAHTSLLPLTEATVLRQRLPAEEPTVSLRSFAF